MTVIKNRSGISWCILYSKNLTQAEKMVFFALKDRAYQVDKTCMKGFYCYLDWIEKNLSLSDKTVQKAIRGLREKQLISSKRVKMYRNVVNQWTINWDIIDDMQKKFKFAEIEYEETDILEDERKPDIQTERHIITPTYEDIEESIEETTVSEVKTPSVLIKEEKKEDERSIIQETGEEDKEQLNRREEQTGSKENEILSEETEGGNEGNGGNEEYAVEDYIDKHINKVLIPLLQNDGDKYYDNLNKFTKEVQNVFPDMQLHDIFSMIDDMVRIRSKKAV